MSERPPRVVVWFSCGATSAIAVKLALIKYKNNIDVRVVYCDPGLEHSDNRRFLHDIEEWTGHPIEILRSSKYRDAWDVWNKTRWLVGVKGARCTTELKKVLRFQYQRADDLQVFGFDAGEHNRIERFCKANPEIKVEFPVYDATMTKKNCLAILFSAGINPPAMYRLGFPNANCIGCVKGGQAYWNLVRKVFPETFSKMARLERSLGAAINKNRSRDGKRKKLFLDELDSDAGRGLDVLLPECGPFCGEIS